MGQSIFVEWVNGSLAEKLFKQRRAAAIKRERELSPDKPESEIVAPEDQDSWWDWVEMHECYEHRGFPSVPMAKSWARRYYKLDLFEMPRIYKNEWPGDENWNSETTVELEYQGDGVWMDLATGNLLDKAS